LGGIYQNLGKLDQADKLLRASLDQRKQIFGSDHYVVAESMVGLGLLRDAQAQYDEAEKLVRDGLDMSKRHLAANHPLIARATSSLGKVLEDRGDYDKAIPVLEESARLQSTSDASKADLGETLSERGVTFTPAILMFRISKHARSTSIRSSTVNGIQCG
jgi:tetratricopeptide (TPR) repeat protein